MNIHLPSGKDGLSSHSYQTMSLSLPRFIPGVADEAAAFQQAAREPINTKAAARID
ncbi:MAG: hypothetical protein U0X75_11525 [Acidobacteriota bacterium]